MKLRHDCTTNLWQNIQLYRNSSLRRDGPLASNSCIASENAISFYSQIRCKNRLSYFKWQTHENRKKIRYATCFVWFVSSHSSSISVRVLILYIWWFVCRSNLLNAQSNYLFTRKIHLQIFDRERFKMLFNPSTIRMVSTTTK